MRVIDLAREEDFAVACQALFDRVSCELGEDWLIVGIETGGMRVVEAWAASRVLSSCSIRAQRPATGAKGRMRPLIRRLPPAVANILRNIERLIFRSLRKSGRTSSRDVFLPQEAKLSISNAARILVVDDAIDSGETLKACLDAINGLNSTARVKTAVLAVTESDPILTADVQLYEGVMLRFPWSSDSVVQT
ncbi:MULTISPECIES: phosphoribosyltransferase family protein [Halomonadaceae]|uniref:Phosphoribosyltransferase domain-containing protein n=1 Tax=Vreelandella halophila TaxID=86177 RepID=A0A9X5B397_9GAMM|nr:MULTISPECIES: phosphoribosyltransferase family protein [Halomonas]MYL25541.1 hypothetical protein [Halomonas utahensis]MYL74777.1 hypothetical protein [Halomonas sp. 22501_18_FS]